MFDRAGRGPILTRFWAQVRRASRVVSGSAAWISRAAIRIAAVAQLVECVLGKDEVTGSIPVSSLCGLGGVVQEVTHLGIDDRRDLRQAREEVFHLAL